MKRIAHALIINQGKVLLHLRDGNHPNPNLRFKWATIGGELESDEDLTAGVLREIEEEASLKPNDVEYIGVLKRALAEHNVEVHTFVVKLTDIEEQQLKLGNEGLEVKFFDVDEVENLALAPELVKFWPLAKQVIKKVQNGASLESIKVLI